jgi:reductive dehalogenase
MTRLFSHRNRPVHLGSFPLERLSRRGSAMDFQRNAPPAELPIEDPGNPHSLANGMREYINVMDRMRAGPVAPGQAPIPGDLQERANHLKAACYYLDVSMAGVCRIPVGAFLEEPVTNHSLSEAAEREYGTGSADNPMAEISVREGRAAWEQSQAALQKPLGHTHALAIVVEYLRDPRPGEPGASWLHGTQAQRAALRAAEVGAVMANYLRMLGFDARLHTRTASELDIDHVLVEAGLAEPTGAVAECPAQVPFLGERFGAVIVATDLELAADKYLAEGACRRARDFEWWVGLGGTRPGYKGPLYKGRDFHMGLYPMETVKRVAEPTTLIDAARVPRVPKRHDMFIRASIGDLGDKAKKELTDFRMITKSPFGHAMIPVLGGMVPLQYGEEAHQQAAGYEDPDANSQMIKAAMYYLGADMVGICEIPDYAWYSHDLDGSEIKPYHKYAISILVDQGYETMEGASGDDWISGAQSMRAYLRAQLIGGTVGSHLRGLGFSARGHSVMDQDVLHIPLNLLAGLGELPRIGEMVLNPFVGPRFKSGILTTNMPLAPDMPIDFGMQDFCNKCLKCARECPVTAIPFGDKIMFNGYEIWKPDVEKCARYRITNAAGSMCGRCMKTCPFNLEGVMAEKPFLWSAMHLPFTRKWIADLDDKVGNGKINPVKKWWWDLDTGEDGSIVPAKRINARELEFRSMQPRDQKLACYPLETVPTPIEVQPSSPDRKQGVAYYRAALSPEEYRQQMSRGDVEQPVKPAWYPQK